MLKIIFDKKWKFAVKGSTWVGKVLQESWDICIFALVKKIVEIFEGESNEERRELLVEFEKTAIYDVGAVIFFLFNSAERIYASMPQQYLQALFFAARLAA